MTICKIPTNSAPNSRKSPARLSSVTRKTTAQWTGWRPSTMASPEPNAATLSPTNAIHSPMS